MDHGNKKKMPGGGMMLLKKMPGGGMMKNKMMPHGGKHDMEDVPSIERTLKKLRAKLRDPNTSAMSAKSARKELDRLEALKTKYMKEGRYSSTRGLLSSLDEGKFGRYADASGKFDTSEPARERVRGFGKGGKQNMPMYAYGGKAFAEKGAMLKAILKDPKQAAIARRELGMK